jgi:GTP-binding protein HflX
LPERLLASFESTLSEIREASLVVIVVDASDHERELHLQTTHALLERMGAKETPRFYVWNKIDRVAIDRRDDRELEALTDEHPFEIVSSSDAHAIERLRESLVRAARRDERTERVIVPYAAGEILSFVYAKRRVEDTHATETGLELTLVAPRATLERIRRSLDERSSS